MVITPALIESLGRKNLSKNADLTAKRFSEDLTAATAEQKKKIAELSGRSRATLYKVKSNGIISARLLASISSVLSVSPYWYTGQADNKEDYSDEIMQKFLTENKYEAALRIAAETAQEKKEKPKRPYKRRNKQVMLPEEPHPADAEEAPSEEVAPEEAPQEKPDAWRSSDAVDRLPLSDAVKLLEALYIRAEVNPSAKDHLREVCDILFS